MRRALRKNCQIREICYRVFAFSRLKRNKALDRLELGLRFRRQSSRNVFHTSPGSPLSAFDELLLFFFLLQHAFSSFSSSNSCDCLFINVIKHISLFQSLYFCCCEAELCDETGILFSVICASTHFARFTSSGDYYQA